jgi:hypothetical protein
MYYVSYININHNVISVMSAFVHSAIFLLCQLTENKFCFNYREMKINTWFIIKVSCELIEYKTYLVHLESMR